MSVIITCVTFGRALTEAETIAIKAQLANCVAADTTDGSKANTNNIGSPSIRIWTTEQAATEWATFCGTFTPPPMETLITTVGS
jgi:hypothetical protein